ncbi:MAG: DEAD/DEAH box helicase [Candidatus Thermoplasmatota archaeon]|nr:DEAD/DEAH box helicase [Candidatus Thermoplasmatota archaeon]
MKAFSTLAIMEASVSPHVSHDMLNDGIVEARAYQLEAVDEALNSSMLLVMPTAAGKTAVIWMMISEKLSGGGKAIMIAPTVGLVEQHIRSLREVLNLDDEIVSVTGQIPPAKRIEKWNGARLVVATPKVVVNDASNGVVDLSDFSVLVVDEAHHCTGDHAMAQVCDKYISENLDPHVLGVTASPGHRPETVREICSRTGALRIHIRNSGEEMLSGYLSELEVREITVTVPEEMIRLSEPFKIWQQGIVDRERRLGRYVMPGMINFSGLSNAMDRAKSAIGRGEASGYQSVSQIAVAMRLHHLINCLMSQGVSASREYLDRLEDEESGSKKTVRDFLRDIRIRELRTNLAEMDEIHSKIGAVRRMVRERIKRDSKSRIIVFANYRDTIASLETSLKGLKGIIPIRFVGQSSRGSRKGLSGREQVRRLDEFRKGNANVLLATSIGEEGLDIPSADLVIFYEPVSSEIRTIQRRGRTGRKRLGEVIVLIAEGTRDEGAKAAALRREENMLRAVHRVSRSLPRTHHSDLSNLTGFSVVSEGIVIDSVDFVKSQREERRTSISEADKTISENSVVKSGSLPSESIRPRGQYGLEDFQN